MYSFVKKYYYKIKSYSFEKNTIVVLSIRKSGTNFLRALLVNYLYAYYEKSEDRIPHKDIDGELFPNRRENVYFGIAKYRPCAKDNPIRKAGYSDILMSHWCDYIEHSPAKKVICIFRNPLDNLVSQYYYFHVNYPGKKQFDSPMACIRHRAFHYFINIYLKMRGLPSQRDGVYLLPYEALLKEPGNTLHQLLLFLEIPVHWPSIEKSIERSSVARVRQEEEVTGQAIHNELPGGAFIRDGQVGKWREDLNEDDVEEIARIFSNHNISLDEFLR